MTVPIKKVKIGVGWEDLQGKKVPQHVRSVRRGGVTAGLASKEKARQRKEDKEMGGK